MVYTGVRGYNIQGMGWGLVYTGVRGYNIQGMGWGLVYTGSCDIFNEILNS